MMFLPQPLFSAGSMMMTFSNCENCDTDLASRAATVETTQTSQNVPVPFHWALRKSRSGAGGAKGNFWTTAVLNGRSSTAGDCSFCSNNTAWVCCDKFPSSLLSPPASFSPRTVQLAGGVSRRLVPMFLSEESDEKVTVSQWSLSHCWVAISAILLWQKLLKSGDLLLTRLFGISRVKFCLSSGI